MNVLLTGPTGFVGARVLEDLLAAGHAVTALAHSRRSLSDIQRIAPQATVVFGDVSDPFEIKGIIPEGIEAVIYLPGLLREDKKRRLTFQRVHVEGVRNLLADAKRVGARRWIQMSALGVGQEQTTKYYSTKWQAEELVRKSDLAWTIVRPSYIFDDRPTKRANFVSELVKVISPTPFVPIPGDGLYRGQPVSLDDVSQTIVQSLTSDRTVGETYELGGPDTLAYNEITQIIIRALGLSRTLVHIPLVLVEAGAALFGKFRFFPATSEQLEMLVSENIVRDVGSESQWMNSFTLPLKRFEPSVRRMLERN
jgi:uncharacterized protein YbjT (DUF2867 family)